MTNHNDSLSERVSESLPSLVATASNLNEASNRLSQLIERIDDALQRLNLGVPAWVQVRSGSSAAPFADDLWSEDLGYDRLGRKWGLMLRRVEGNFGKPEPDEENWSFNEAPRPLRIKAAAKIPELIAKLDREAKEMVEQVSASIDATAPLVKAIEISARPQRSIKKKLGGRS